MSDIKTQVERLLRGEGEITSTSLPVERLASALAALPSDPSRFAECRALLADGLTGGLLYRTHQDLVLTRIEMAIPALDAPSRFELLRAMLEMRPIESENLVRYVRLSLDALGFDGAAPASVCGAWSKEQHLVVYRWSNAMRYATSLQVGEIAALLAERGIQAEGGHPWDVFHSVVGYQPTVILTPRQSPTVRAELESMQRHDWLDMPWMFGGPEATFVIDEIEEDSSPENMSDGGRIAQSLMTQRSPSTDFFGKTYAWHPRQTLEHVQEVANEHGFDRVDAAPCDRVPRRLDRHELGPAARALQGRALRAMAALPPGALPIDLGLVFVQAEEGARGVLELSMSTTFGSDGKKHLIQIALGDPDAIMAALREHARLLSPGALPLLLAKLFALSPELRVHAPDGPFVVVDRERVALWDPSASREQPAFEMDAADVHVPEALLGSWRGQITPDDWEDYQPAVLELFIGENGLRALATTPQVGTVEMVGSAAGGRVALRQSDPHAQYLIELAWEAEASTLTGRWRHYGMGGSLSLSKDASGPRDVPAEVLLDEITSAWSSCSRLDLDALRFPGERELLHTLFGDEHFRASYLESAKNRAVRTEAMQIDAMLGRGASLLTRAMLPSAFRALDASREALGLVGDVKLWVHNDFSLNAFVTVDEGSIAIHFTSGLLEVLTEVELQAAIGHELGHVLFGTHDLAIRLQSTHMSGDSRLRYLALRRHQELSADRMSLVACADPHAVFVVQTMLRTGIRKRDLFGGVDALIESAKAEVDALRARPRSSVALDSHPYTAVRTVALDLFARSSAFRALRPDARTDSVDDATIAEELAALSALLDVPVVAAAPVDASRSISRFTALAALRLVEADQTITVRELAALGKLDPALPDELREVLAWTHERRDVEILVLARDVNLALPVPDREQLLVKLLGVVRADNVVQYAETSIVQDMGQLLQVDTHSFRKTIDELYRGSR